MIYWRVTPAKPHVNSWQLFEGKHNTEILIFFTGYIYNAFNKIKETKLLLYTAIILTWVVVRDPDLQFHPPLNQLWHRKLPKSLEEVYASQTKYIIENVRRFFEEEKAAKRSTLISKRQSSRQDSQKSDGLLKTSVLIKYLYKILFIYIIYI